MDVRRITVVFAALIAFSTICLFVPHYGTIRWASAFLALFYMPGFSFILATSDSKRRLLDILLMPLLFSPALVAIVLVLLSRAGLVFHHAIVLCTTLFALLAVFSLYRLPALGIEHRSPDRSIAAVAVGFAAIIALLYLANRFLIVRSDAWFHGCVAHDILARGIPPMEPAFPDVPLRYMWIYHAFIAAWKNLSGLSVFPALAVFNVVNALLFPYLAGRFASALFPERRHVLAAAILAVVGIESALWILWPLNLSRALAGEVSGAAEIHRVLASVHLNDARVIDSLRLHWTWMASTPDKHLTITAFGHALNLFLCAFLAAGGALCGVRSFARRLIILILALVGALLFHVIVGAALAVSAIGAATICIIFRLARRYDVLPLREAISMLAASAFAIAVSLPYVRSLLGGTPATGGPASYLHFGMKNILTIALPFLVLYPASRIAWSELIKHREISGRMSLLWLGPLAALNVFVNLPTVNESKLVFPFFMLSVPFLARGIVAWIERARARRRALAIAWIAMLFIPPFLLTLRGFWLDKPRDFCERKRHEVSESEIELYAWVRSSTPIAASIIERSTCGVMPVFADRRSFIPNRETITVNGYAGPKVDLYIRVHENLFSDDPDIESNVAALLSTRNEYCLVLWNRDLDGNEPLRLLLRNYGELFVTVFENEAGICYAIKASAAHEGAEIE